MNQRDRAPNGGTPCRAALAGDSTYFALVSSAAFVAVLAVISPARAIAEERGGNAENEESKRRYRLLRDDENWAWLRSPEHISADAWDAIKYLRPVKDHDDIYFTLGGEVRLWFEGYRNELWGKTQYKTNVSWLQRYMLHIDAHITPYVRAFVQLKTGLEVFRRGGPRPIDKDLFDFNQAYVDAIAIPGATLDAEPHLLLRAGRQEMSYGSGRFIDVREGPNVRVGYDGVRLISRAGIFRFDAFAVRPAETKPGALDDGFTDTESFWGSWLTLSSGPILVDAYYLGRQREQAKYQKASGKEERHTLGGRVRGKLGAIEIEGEVAYQVGSLGAIPIRAWTVATEAVSRLPHLPLSPVTTLGLGITSGDGGSSVRALGTFSALFPRGTYFGLVSANGPSNNVSPHASLVLSLPASITVTAEGWAFWRQVASDGVYGVPGNLLRQGDVSQGRFLGVQMEDFVAWQLERHLSLNATYAHFWTGDFFSRSSPGQDIDYGAAWVSYKF